MKQAKEFIFDDLYSETLEETEHSIAQYLKVYSLESIVYEEDVTYEFFEYVKRKKYFVIVAIYDEQGQFLLQRTTESQFGWSLPGGSVSSKETIFQAVRRNSEKISKHISLCEVEPIAIVTNKFNYESNSFEHHGIVFLARQRETITLSPTDTFAFVRVTDEELEKVYRHANKIALELCSNRIKEFETAKQDNEIDANEASKAKYLLHNNFVKRFILTSKRKKKDAQIALISELIGDSSSIIDVSCGDSSWPQTIIKTNPSVEVFFANDLSWSQVEIGASKSPKIQYSNHDAQYLPFIDKTFDMSMCMNTLHHMPSRKHLEKMLDSMDRVSKSILIWEVSDPKKDRIIPKYLNKYYYEWWLKDQGIAYVDDDTFKYLISRKFSGRKIQFGNFSNIQGKYNYALIKSDAFDTPAAVIEVESKYQCSSFFHVEKELINDGYKKADQEAQSDIYFSDSAGNFVRNNTCLRIRSDSESNISIDYKGPSNDLSAGTISKIEHNLKITDKGIKSAEKFLYLAGYHRHIEVKKRRVCYTKNYEDNLIVTISEDNIEGLGTYVEIEVTSIDLTNKALVEKLHDEVQEKYIHLLGERVNIPYRDLVADTYFNKLIGKNIKVIAFDLDGTLLPETTRIFYEAWNHVSVNTYDHFIEYEDYCKYEVQGEEQLFDLLKDKLNLNISKKEYFSPIYATYREKLLSAYNSSILCQSLHPLNAIPNHYKIALVTHSRRDMVNELLNRCNCSSVFDLIICREDIQDNLKPSPSGYLQVIDYFNISNDEILVIEDSKKGVDSAIAAGAKVLVIESNHEWANNYNLQTIKSCAELSLISIASERNIVKK